MDEAEVVRINVPTKASAEVTIDLRQNGLVHLFTVDNMEGLTKLNSDDDENLLTSNKDTADVNVISHNASIQECSSNGMEPSTIIHLKIVTPQCNSEEIQLRNSTVEVNYFPDNSSPNSFTNKNCLKVRSSLCEMHREKRIEHMSDQVVEQKNILKEFEITRQLEKLRTETKKISRRKYTHHIERIPGQVRLHSPKSEVSDRSVTDISVIFSDMCEQTNPATQSNHLKVEENLLVKKNEELLGNLIPEETSIQMIDQAKSPKRKNDYIFGPLSKKMRSAGRDAQFPPPELFDNSRKPITFACCPRRMYFNGRMISKTWECNPRSPEKEISLLVESEEESDGYSQIGLELLVLWKMSDGEIDELKEQVKEEYRHKQKEHIMPLILNMSPDQIESTYFGVQDTMKMYEITEQDSDDDESQPSLESVEEDCKSMELKSLDALYREEFSKEYYRDLFNTVEGDSFWKDKDEHPGEKQTNYSKNRPKRSTVDYTPTAYSFIGYMEGRRFRRNSKSTNRWSSQGRQRKVSYKEEDLTSDCENSCDEFSDYHGEKLTDESSRDDVKDDGDENSENIKLVDINLSIDNNLEEEGDDYDTPPNNKQRNDIGSLSHPARCNGHSVLCKQTETFPDPQPAADGSDDDACDGHVFKKMSTEIDNIDSHLTPVNTPSRQSADANAASPPSSADSPQSIRPPPLNLGEDQRSIPGSS